MDNRQLPPTAEPDMPGRITEIRTAERSAGHEARNLREARA